MESAAVSASQWGWLPALSLLQAAGLLAIAQANAASRAGLASAEYYLWAGLLIIILPVTFRMLSYQAAHQERVSLIITLAISLYLVKVFHSPLAFTFADEFVHLYNVEALRTTQQLFTPNVLLPVTPFYPGLHLATVALAELSGLSSFAAGLIVVGVGRIILLLALFLALGLASDSGRVAGLGTILYTANTNFIYWSAQFAYESLALPLAAVVVVAVLASARSRSARVRAGYTLAAIPLIIAVVVSHHLSSYALAALLTLFSLCSILIFKNWHTAPWHLAIIAILACGAWLQLVASSTIGYLSPVVTDAFESMLGLITQEDSVRQLFSSSRGPTTSPVETPLWEKVIAFGAVILLMAGMLQGVLVVWRRYRHNVFAICLTLLALGYFPLQALRLTSAGWETSNRASEFLFVGLGFVIGAGFAFSRAHERFERANRVVAMVFVAVVFLGGIMAGWPRPLRLGLPYTVDASGWTIEPQGVAAARWASENLPTANIVVGDQANARLLLAYAGQQAHTGQKYGVRDLLYAQQLERGEREILEVLDANFVVFDRRRISWDNMLGIYFERHTDLIPPEELYLPAQAEEKFNREPDVDRLFDSGHLVIFDVNDVRGRSDVEFD